MVLGLPFSPRISDNDLEQKMRKIREVLQKGQKVSVVVRYKNVAEQQMSREALNYIMATMSTEFKVQVPSDLWTVGDETFFEEHCFENIRGCVLSVAAFDCSSLVCK